MDGRADSASTGGQRLRDRYRGPLLGTAVGDALGAPFEGWPHVDAASLRKWEQSCRPLRWTDDTHMTIGVAESLIACSGFDGNDMAARFAANYEREPWRGYGAGPPQIFEALRKGARWDEPATRLFGGAGSFGNGAAMRAAPAGLAAHPDFPKVVELARAQARITHAHELGQQGAALLAGAVSWLLGASSDGWSGMHSLLDDLPTAAPAEVFTGRLRRIATIAPSWTSQEVVAALGNGIEAVEAVPAALYAFLRHPGSFVDAVRCAIALGGDTDTIAAMTGALSGAFLGASAIPTVWLERLEDRFRLMHLADGLLGVAMASRGSDHSAGR